MSAKSFSIFKKSRPVYLKQTFFNSSLASKFKTIYIALIIICIFCNVIIAQVFYTNKVKNAVTKLTSQTMETISQNVDSSLNTISKTSTYMLGTSDVQNYLQNSSSSRYSILSKNLRNALYLSLESMPLVSSILIINENGTYEGAARYTMPKLLLSSPKEASWYEKLHDLKGGPIFLINGGGYFSSKDGSNYISLIRLINSTETAHPLGYMVINISMDSLLSFAQDRNDSYSGICVYAQGQIILSSFNESLNDYIKKSSPENFPSASDVFIEKERYLLLNFQDSIYDWNYLSAIKYTTFSNETKPFFLIILLTMLISATLFLFIAFYTNQALTTPLHRLMIAMKKTENGDFKHAYVTNYKDEIGLLQEAYNEMVDKIQNLLEAKIHEQKLLRQAELNTLQEQIKPHFLYNSLSAIAYLITSEQNDTAYDLVISLSEYYRESLSKGSEIVPLSTEINIVRNYLKLQKMRFPDIFDDVYEVQEEALNLPVPRLILQPLVENSLYHGIIPTGEYGIIKIKACIRNDHLILCISDNGLGMASDRLLKILGGKLETNAMSFGLRGTVERLKIFYDDKNIYQINSTINQGTEITFSLPIQKPEEHHESE